MGAFFMYNKIISRGVELHPRGISQVKEMNKEQIKSFNNEILSYYGKRTMSMLNTFVWNDWVEKIPYQEALEAFGRFVAQEKEQKLTIANLRPFLVKDVQPQLDYAKATIKAKAEMSQLLKELEFLKEAIGMENKEFKDKYAKAYTLNETYKIGYDLERMFKGGQHG